MLKYWKCLQYKTTLKLSRQAKNGISQEDRGKLNEAFPFPTCQFQLAETLPISVFGRKNADTPKNIPMHQAWSNLFDAALAKIEIVSYHWGLQKGSKRGKRVFDALLNALDRNVSIDIVHTANKIKEDDGTDIQDLFTYASTLVKFRLLSMPSLLKNGGVLHSKLLLVDRMHFYLGSANLSDRGLNQRQELGIFVKNCPKLAQDAGKLFDVYWDLSRGKTAKIPQRWNHQF
eukprot:10310.XXX_67242_65517_1 [CDS] Oithona nana genome sequencing.